MPTVRRTRTIDAPPEQLWAIVANPHQLPRWWPAVRRVEDASPEAWTKVLLSPRGKMLRADFTRLAEDEPRRVAWRQEVDESPFERILAESVTEISLERAGPSSTRVELRASRRLRGLARLGGLMVRRATRKQVEEALEGLDRIAGRSAT